MKNNNILLLSLLFLISCAIKPTLKPINIQNVNIEKDGNIYFELTSSHKKVIRKNTTNSAGIHNDTNEDDFLPVPFSDYLEKNIINNLMKSPGLIIVESRKANDFYVNFDLKSFNVFRETSSSAALVKSFFPLLYIIGMGVETCTAEISGDLTVYNQETNEILCDFNISTEETVRLRHFTNTNLSDAYSDATRIASSKLVEQIIFNLLNC
jgi:hypothetical protein